MPNTNATGLHVRHAVSRALATSNTTPLEATFKVQAANVRISERGRVLRSEVTVSIRKARPLIQWEPHELKGWVNPDGEHPLMTVARLDNPVFVDVFPVTWYAWLQTMQDRLPEGCDPFHPCTGISLPRVQEYVEHRGGRLPTRQEFRQIWGDDAHPWGPSPDRRLGRLAAPRFGEREEVGQHPPHNGLWDLGCWLWHWVAEGEVSGGSLEGEVRFGEPPSEATHPLGFRMVVDP